MLKRPVEERFLEKIQIRDDGCWIWTAATGGNGYGKISVNLKPRWAHRVAYEIFIGKVPDGLVLDHLCRKPLCVNPLHLEPVTQLVNVRRGAVKKTHCIRGHELTGAKWCLGCRRELRATRT